MSTQDQAGPEERPERSFLPAPSDQANEEQTTPAIEPYAQLVEQLSSDHIEVRLGALYELECLAHARPEHRQAFVDLLCAYLRAPDPTVEDAADTSDPASAGSDSAAGCVEERQTAHERTRKQAEERQFRQSVQRVLTDHLRAERGRNPEELINPRFWPGIDLDLSGATLHDWDFTGCEVRTADFSRTHFHGFAQFREAVLHSPATFDRAVFRDDADFTMSIFHGDARFTEAVFRGDTDFHGAVFHGTAGFDRAAFHGDTGFGDGGVFHGNAEFTKAVFHGNAEDGAWVRVDCTAERMWPEGWRVQEPTNPAKGRLDGIEGVWGFLEKEDVEHDPPLAEQTTAEDLAQREQTATGTRHKATEPRFTDFYAKAVEQLSSDQVEMCLDGLYGLERLAQDNPGHRQTIVDALCAYLRTPDPTDKHAESTPDPATPVSSDGTGPAEGKQVHQAVQRILTDHLRPERAPETGQPTNPRFWPDIDLDLSEATLHDWDFTGCEVRTAFFMGTRFHGTARFGKVVFHGPAEFDKVVFHGDTEFDEAAFHGTTSFFEAVFRGNARFNGAVFHGLAMISRAAFHDEAGFRGAVFHGRTQFCDGGVVHGRTGFGDGAVFHRYAGFDGAVFHGYTKFNSAVFHTTAGFDRTAFHGETQFREVVFHGDARFGETVFHNVVKFSGAWVQVDRAAEWVWPDGWRVREPVSPTEGRLDGIEGVWGFLEKTAEEDKPTGPGDGEEGPPETT